jgi:hypothetical protein
MTVWGLLRVLLGHVLHGRAGQRVYVIPEPTGDEAEARCWVFAEMYAPNSPQDRFVVAAAQHAPRRYEDSRIPGGYGFPGGSG